jgi:rubrerythrin
LLLELLAALVAVRAERGRDLEMVRRMAVYGPGEGTTAEEALTTIAKWAENKLAAVSSPGEEPCWVCAVCGAVDDDEPADLPACPKCGEPPPPKPYSGADLYPPSSPGEETP